MVVALDARCAITKAPPMPSEAIADPTEAEGPGRPALIAQSMLPSPVFVNARAPPSSESTCSKKMQLVLASPSQTRGTTPKETAPLKEPVTSAPRAPSDSMPLLITDPRTRASQTIVPVSSMRITLRPPLVLLCAVTRAPPSPSGAMPVLYKSDASPTGTTHAIVPRDVTCITKTLFAIIFRRIRVAPADNEYVAFESRCWNTVRLLSSPTSPIDPVLPSVPVMSKPPAPSEAYDASSCWSGLSDFRTPIAGLMPHLKLG